MRSGFSVPRLGPKSRSIASKPFASGPESFMGDKRTSILEVGKGGLPPLLRIARIKIAGASHPSLPLNVLRY